MADAELTGREQVVERATRSGGGTGDQDGEERARDSHRRVDMP
jgi:hypothetical protein